MDCSLPIAEAKRIFKLYGKVTSNNWDEVCIHGLKRDSIKRNYGLTIVELKVKAGIPARNKYKTSGLVRGQQRAEFKCRECKRAYYSTYWKNFGKIVPNNRRCEFCHNREDLDI